MLFVIRVTVLRVRRRRRVGAGAAPRMKIYRAKRLLNSMVNNFENIFSRLQKISPFLYEIHSFFLAQHPFLCDRKCSKKRTCKQHKCNETCCVDREHLCMMICGRKLACGVHTCESLCHTGRCRPCTNTSNETFNNITASLDRSRPFLGFDELRCFCGQAVIYPPISCGTRPPVCDKLCTRAHNCDHPVVHNCHSEPSCPPCAYLTQKWCYGNHEVRSNLSVEKDSFSIRPFSSFAEIFLAI